jgi:hypothetical protein
VFIGAVLIFINTVLIFINTGIMMLFISIVQTLIIIDGRFFMQCQSSLNSIHQQQAPQSNDHNGVNQSAAKPLDLSSIDAVKLDQLPESMLNSIVAFLPLRAASNCRLISKNFNEAGKDVIHCKLHKAGVPGQSFDETLKNATLFEKQADEQKGKNQALMNRVQSTTQKHVPLSTMLDTTYLPMGTGHQYPRLKNILENSAALDRYQHQLTNRDSRTQLIGIRLATAPLKVKVSARQYREELQKQKDTLTELNLNAVNHESIIKDLEQGIKNMEKHEPNGHQIYLGVAYLPNISELPQSSGITVRTSYQSLMQDAGVSIASKYAVNIPGVADDKGAQTGIDVSKSSIILKVPASQLLAGARASNALIDKQVSENRKKLYEL